MSVFSDRLKEAMDKRGITQAQLSKELKITKSALSQYLSARFAPKDDRLIPIAEKLNVSPAWLRGYLSEEEELLISRYRSMPEIKAQIDDLIYRTTYSVFRAAKSHDGTSAPTHEALTETRLKRISSAPETNEDL